MKYTIYDSIICFGLLSTVKNVFVVAVFGAGITIIVFVIYCDLFLDFVLFSDTNNIFNINLIFRRVCVILFLFSRVVILFISNIWVSITVFSFH